LIFFGAEISACDRRHGTLPGASLLWAYHESGRPPMFTESRGKTEPDATLIREVDENELDHVCGGGGGGGGGIDPGELDRVCGGGGGPGGGIDPGELDRVCGGGGGSGGGIDPGAAMAVIRKIGG
jgi:hypothetical protein